MLPENLQRELEGRGEVGGGGKGGEKEEEENLQILSNCRITYFEQRVTGREHTIPTWLLQPEHALEQHSHTGSLQKYKSDTKHPQLLSH